MKATPLKRKTPLKAYTPLKQKTPLRAKTELKRKSWGSYTAPSAPSIMQTDKECYLSGVRQNLVKHHIFPGRRRKASDEWGCWVWLAADRHTGADGVHNDSAAMRVLQDECRARFTAMYGEDKFVEVFGH
jgi:hypothetical protein